MRCRLNPAAAARYRRQGFLSPIVALTRDEMIEHMARLQRVEASRAGRLPPAQNVKPHLLMTWLWELVRDRRILDPVENVLGPDILCWASSFFDKRPGQPLHVPWHQDATYWGLTAPEALTAWIAFTPSHAGNGCMRVIPGSHGRPLAHGGTGDRHNMLAGGETVLVEVDEADAVDIVLAPGEMSLHHLLLIHGSQPNSSGERRCGFAIRYIAGHVGKARGGRGTATLVRGRDHGRFDLEEPPEADFHPAAVERYNAVLRRWMRGVFEEVSGHRGAAQHGKPAGELRGQAPEPGTD